MLEVAEAPSTLGLGEEPAEGVKRARAERILSSAQAKLVTGVRLEAKGIEELASAQGISPEALRMRLSRAEDKLVRWLQPNDDEPEQSPAAGRRVVPTRAST